MTYVDELKVTWLMPMRTCTRSSMALIKDCKTLNDTGHILEILDEKKDYTLIFNIRNPLPRIVSLYWLWSFHNNDYDRDFESWLYDCKTWQRPYQLHLDRFVILLKKKPDYFVRTEFFDDDLKKIIQLKKHFDSVSEVYHQNVKINHYKKEFESKTDKIRIPWHEQYNQKTADFVYRLCKFQFVMFNYNPNYWKDGTP